MRLIGHLPVESSARTFGDYLYVQGIDNQIDQDKDHGWAIWVRDEDKLQEASSLLTGFVNNPEAPEFAAKAREASNLRSAREKENAAYRKRLHEPATVFRPVGPYGLGPLTFALIGASIIVFLLSKFGDDPRPISALFMSDYIGAGLQEIKRGQLWRLVTPIFIHFGFLHILFNMMWLYDLGGMIEARQGPLRLGIIVLLIAALSNLAQYFLAGPVFGGMSGVVYGLLGYVWMRGKFDPASGLFLHQTTVLMMLIWFFVCLLGWVGRVANGAHAAGLILGMGWGYLSSLSFRR